MQTTELITTREARFALKVGKTKLSELIASGRLEAIRLGERTVRVKADSLRRLVDGHANFAA